MVWFLNKSLVSPVWRQSQGKGWEPVKLLLEQGLNQPWFCQGGERSESPKRVNRSVRAFGKMWELRLYGMDSKRHRLVQEMSKCPHFSAERMGLIGDSGAGHSEMVGLAVGCSAHPALPRVIIRGVALLWVDKFTGYRRAAMGCSKDLRVCHIAVQGQ